MIRQDSASFEEWKPADMLDKLAVRMPERYQPEASDGWRCPPGEAAAATLGLSYRLRSSAEYHPLYIQNMKFLQDFWTHPFSVSAEQEDQVQTALSASPGVSVAALLDAHPGLPVDAVWAMLTEQRIFTDLSACDLMDWDQVCLYLLAEQVEQAELAHNHEVYVRRLSSPLLFDGRLWEAEIQSTSVFLRPEVGVSLILPAEQFEHLLELGYIQQADLATPSPLQDAVWERLSSVTGKPFAKPWATFITDAYSRRILACYVTYDPPSYRSAMMAFRLCVQRKRECATNQRFWND